MEQEKASGKGRMPDAAGKENAMEGVRCPEKRRHFASFLSHEKVLMNKYAKTGCGMALYFLAYMTFPVKMSSQIVDIFGRKV